MSALVLTVILSVAKIPPVLIDSQEEYTVIFQHIKYADINARQKGLFNFQKVSGLPADYGFATYRLTDDWNGADFLAVHLNGVDVLRVQLKGSLIFAKKYMGKDLWVRFRHKGEVYLYPHDELLVRVPKENVVINNTSSWEVQGVYHFPSLAKWLEELLEPYRLEPIAFG